MCYMYILVSTHMYLHTFAYTCMCGHRAVLCSAAWCQQMSCDAMQRNATQFNATHSNSIQCSVMAHRIMQCAFMFAMRFLQFTSCAVTCDFNGIIVK